MTDSRSSAQGSNAMTDKPSPRPSPPKPKPIVNLALERARRRPQSLRDRVRGGWASPLPTHDPQDAS